MLIWWRYEVACALLKSSCRDNETNKHFTSVHITQMWRDCRHYKMKCQSGCTYKAAQRSWVHRVHHCGNEFASASLTHFSLLLHENADRMWMLKEGFFINAEVSVVKQKLRKWKWFLCNKMWWYFLLNIVKLYNHQGNLLMRHRYTSASPLWAMAWQVLRNNSEEYFWNWSVFCSWYDSSAKNSNTWKN